MIIKDTNLKGLRELLDNVRNMGKDKVFVGVPASSNTIHEGGINMATLAAVHEFGSSKRNIPERSFLRSAIIEGKDKINAEVAKGVQAYLSQGKQIDLMFYDRIGLLASNLVKDKIHRGPFVRLSDATVARRIKNTDRPVNDTGALRQSITWVVRE